MEIRVITAEQIKAFESYLVAEEKSAATQEKYLRDILAFWRFSEQMEITKELVISYKKCCVERGYAVRSINSMIASVNSFLTFMGWHECKVKSIRLQRQTYCAEEKELTKAEYLRLLKASEKMEQLNLILQTICSTGIRVSELRYFTVEAVRAGKVQVNCKSKTRTVFVPSKLRKKLISFAGRNRIIMGAIFRGRTGEPLDRSSIWHKMKNLCKSAGVAASKVFPHNLRKLFARTFYCAEKDIAKLADILGHSSINTTRIYIMTSGEEHRKKIERLGLVV